MSAEFPKLEAVRRRGDEPFLSGGARLDVDVLQFWQWAASDLVSNAMRGILAEYIVATALGLDHGLRTEWDAFDLNMADGTRIEVKSASYIQSWHHKNLSKIVFGIRRTRGWDAATNTVSELSRQADVYVFCLLAHQEQDSLDPLNLDQWEFYLLASEVLDRACPIQKSISLPSLLKLEPIRVKYHDIAGGIQRLIA